MCGELLICVENQQFATHRLKLRRMRVRNEISLSTEEGACRAEDLEALHEELSSLSKQIEDAEDQRSPRQTLPRERLYKAMAGNGLE